MSKNEMIERSRKALAEFALLPPDQQVEELVASGAINDRGEVLLGRGRESGTRTADEGPAARDPR